MTAEGAGQKKKRRPGEGRDLERLGRAVHESLGIPAFAGMTAEGTGQKKKRRPGEGRDLAPPRKSLTAPRPQPSLPRKDEGRR